jgi:hypothetical protein
MHFLTLSNGFAINLDQIVMVQFGPGNASLFNAFEGMPPYNVTDPKDVEKL